MQLLYNMSQIPLLSLPAFKNLKAVVRDNRERRHARPACCSRNPSDNNHNTDMAPHANAERGA